MTQWNDMVILLSILLLFFLLWKEIKRKNKGRLLLRLITTFLAVGSLACLALPLYYSKEESTTSSNEAIVLTEGYNKDSVANFIQANGIKLPVFVFDKNIKFSSKLSTHYIPDIHLLPQQYKDINTLHVFGFGLSPDDLNALVNTTLVFHSSHLPSGINAIHWAHQLQSGEGMILQGNCNNTTSSRIKIVLGSFGTTIDSAYVSANTNGAFTLNTIPKAEGRTTYSLVVMNDKDTLEKETIPVQVETGAPLKILMLASSPDFDNKFLQNSLSKNGYEVVARTTISKNKYAYDYLNTSAISAEHITASLLDKFTIMIADAAELAVLPKAELANIQSGVAQKGMGLVVKADSAAPSSFYATNFPVSAIAGDTQQQLKMYLLDTSEKLPVLPVDYPLSISNESNTQPLVWDKQNRQYVSSSLYGSGKIIFTTLSHTYTWALSGNEKEYNQFWSALLDKAAAKPSAGEAWRISPALPLVNMPVQLNVQTSNTGIPQGLVNGTPVYLENNADLPYEWSGRYYPTKEGWQTGIGLNGKPFYWYAYLQTDWQNVYASQNIIATQQYISSHLYKAKQAGANQIVKQTEFPKLYLFLLFILCCSFLWAEEKGLILFHT